MFALATTTTLTAALTACVSGTPTNATPNTGIEGIVNGNTGGATSGSGGGSIVATYKLASVGGAALPALLVNDSVVNSDSTHIFRAWLDSSIISLNSDTTASETNYLSLFETRTGAGLNSDSVFVNDSLTLADTASGTYDYNSTASNVSLALTDTINNNTLSSVLAFNVSTDSLTGYVSYTVFDLNGIPQSSASALFVYVESGASASGILKSPRVKVSSHRQVIVMRTAPPA